VSTSLFYGLTEQSLLANFVTNTAKIKAHRNRKNFDTVIRIT